MNISRWGFDLVSGYKHKPIPADSKMSVEELKKGGYILDEKAWLRVSIFIFRCYFRCFITVVAQRILFLETIAGVPGMVAAMLRHLTSLRLMVSQTSFLTVKFLMIWQRRDSGWIHTLLEEAENERMHLM
jgi:hypothetical protein